MKRKTIAVLLCCMALAAFAGCGGADSKESVQDTETVQGTETADAVYSVDIEYDISDYVTLGDYKNIEVTLNEEDYAVTDESLNLYVDQMIARYQPYVPDTSKTVVEQGDVVDVDYVGKKDGVAFDGGSAENTLIDTGTNAEATSGNGYIDGFSDGLIGASVGGTIDCEVTFPDDYQSEELKGQTVVFTFTVNAIEQPVTRENLDDAYVKENFGSESVEEFYQTARAALEQQMEQTSQSDIRNQVIDSITEVCTVDRFPEGLLEARVQEYIDAFQEQYCTDGTSLADFLEDTYGSTEEEFYSQTTEYMEENLKEELIFEAIAEAEEIEFDQDEYDAYIQNLVANAGFLSEEAMYESFGPSKEAGEKYLKKIFMGNKACTLVSETAKVTYTEAETQTGEAESESQE